MTIDFRFNLFQEYEFNSVFAEPRNGKEALQRDLFRQLMRSDSLLRSGRLAERDEEMIKRTEEEIDALVIALRALKEEEQRT